MICTEYYLADKIKKMGREKHVTCVGDKRVACRVLVGNFLSRLGPISFSGKTLLCAVS